jgi:hypothetical protein
MPEYGLDGGQVAFLVTTVLIAVGLVILNVRVRRGEDDDA